MKFDVTTELDIVAERRKIAELLDLIRGNNPFTERVWSTWPRRDILTVPGTIPEPGRTGLGRIMGRALVQTAHLKIAAKMAGNAEHMLTTEERTKAILDDDWCPTRPRVVGPPKWPGPRPGEPLVTWQDFEQLVSTMVDYQSGLQDGALKEEIGGMIKDTVQ